MSESLVVVLADSLTDGGRKAAIGVGVALAALARGAKVHLFLSLESVMLGTPSGADGIRPRGFSEPLSDYLEHFLDLGGDSMAAMLLLDLTNERFGVDLAFEELLELPSLRAVAATIDERR